MSYIRSKPPLGIIITGYGDFAPMYPSSSSLAPFAPTTMEEAAAGAMVSTDFTESPVALPSAPMSPGLPETLPDYYPSDYQEEMEMAARSQELAALAIERELLAPQDVEPEVAAREAINTMERVITSEQQERAVVNPEGELMFPVDPGRDSSDYMNAGPTQEELMSDHLARVAMEQQELLAHQTWASAEQKRVEAADNAALAAILAAAGSAAGPAVIDVPPAPVISSKKVAAPTAMKTQATSAAASPSTSSAASSSPAAAAAAATTAAKTAAATVQSAGCGNLFLWGGLALAAYLVLKK